MPSTTLSSWKRALSVYTLCVCLHMCVHICVCVCLCVVLYIVYLAAVLVYWYSVWISSCCSHCCSLGDTVQHTSTQLSFSLYPLYLSMYSFLSNNLEMTCVCVCWQNAHDRKHFIFASLWRHTPICISSTLVEQKGFWNGALTLTLRWHLQHTPVRDFSRLFMAL